MNNVNKLLLAAAFAACITPAASGQVTHFSVYGNEALSLSGGLACIGGGFINEGNISDADVTNYASYASLVDLLGCTASARVPLVADVTTTTVATAPTAQRFVGMHIGTANVLSLLPNATIRTYNNGSLVETFSGTGLLSLLAGVDQYYIYGYATQPFNQVELSVSGLAGVLTGINYYYGFATADTFTLLGPLSIATGSFEATNKDGMAWLSWQADDTYTPSVFYIERSINGKDFSVLGSLTQSETHKYVYTDVQPARGVTNYYRIRTMEPDGRQSFTRVIPLKFSLHTASSLEIYPNPSTGKVNIVAPFSGRQQLALTDISGKTVFSGTYYGQATITLTSELATLPAGTYHITITGENGERVSGTWARQ